MQEYKDFVNIRLDITCCSNRTLPDIKIDYRLIADKAFQEKHRLVRERLTHLLRMLPVIKTNTNDLHNLVAGCWLEFGTVPQSENYLEKIRKRIEYIMFILVTRKRIEYIRLF